MGDRGRSLQSQRKSGPFPFPKTRFSGSAERSRHVQLKHAHSAAVWCPHVRVYMYQICSGHVRRTLFYLNQQVPPNENFGQEPIAQSIIRVWPCCQRHFSREGTVIRRCTPWLKRNRDRPQLVLGGAKETWTVTLVSPVVSIFGWR